ncbi:16568_t:CDS:2, partial [Gigaspora rosea]
MNNDPIVFKPFKPSQNSVKVTWVKENISDDGHSVHMCPSTRWLEENCAAIFETLDGKETTKLLIEIFEDFKDTKHGTDVLIIYLPIRIRKNKKKEKQVEEKLSTAYSQCTENSHLDNMYSLEFYQQKGIEVKIIGNEYLEKTDQEMLVEDKDT